MAKDDKYGLEPADDKYGLQSAATATATAEPPSDEEIEAAYGKNVSPKIRAAVKSGVAPMQKPTNFEADNSHPEYYGFTPGNVAKNVYGGAKGLVSAGAEGLGDILFGQEKNESGQIEHGLGGLAGFNSKGEFAPGERVSALTQKYLTDPAAAEMNKAEEAKSHGDTLGAIGHGAAAAIPLVGPWAASIGEQAKTGDVGGAAGQVAGTIGAGEAIPHVPKAIEKTTGVALDALGHPLGLGAEGHELLTKGVRPRARATGWQDAIQNEGVQRAIVDQHAKTPITNLEDFKDAVPQMKENIWDTKVQPALERQGPRPVDMKPAADGIRKAITPEMREFDAAGVQGLEDLATKLDRARTVEEANRLQKYANGQVESYFNKYPTARRSALVSNPETLGWETARRGIRDQLVSTLEDAGETQAAPARETYGHLTTLEKELERKVNVNDRSKPTSLYNFLGSAGGLASLLMGHGVAAAGLYGLGKVAEHFNKPDTLIKRGIEKLNPPPEAPFTPPNPYVPPQYAEPANPVRASLPAPAVEAGYDAGPSGPVRGGRWTTPAGLLPESVMPPGGPKGLLPGIGETVPRGTPLPEPGAAELAHPEMFQNEPIGREAQPQVYRRPKGQPGAGQMARGFTGEAKPRVVGWTADGGPIYEKTPGAQAKAPETAPVREPEAVKPMVPPAREVGLQPLGKGLELGKGEDLGAGLGTEHEITKDGKRIGSVTVEPRDQGVLHVHWLGGDLGADVIRGPLKDALLKEYPETTKLTYDRRRLAKGATAATTEPREMNLGAIGEHAPTGSIWEGLSDEVKQAFEKEKIGPVKSTGMEDLKVGDTFVDSEGEPRRVMEITEDGKVHTADGTEKTYDGDVEHLGEINSPRAQLARGGKFIPKEEPEGAPEKKTEKVGEAERPTHADAEELRSWGENGETESSRMAANIAEEIEYPEGMEDEIGGEVTPLVNRDANGRITSAASLRDNPFTGDLYISYMATHPEMLGQGAGTAMLNKIMKIAADRDAGLSLEDTPHSAPFWKKMGAKEHGGFLGWTPEEVKARVEAKPEATAEKPATEVKHPKAPVDIRELKYPEADKDAKTGEPVTIHAYRASDHPEFRTNEERGTFFSPEATPEHGNHIYRAKLEFKNPLVVDDGVAAAKQLGDAKLEKEYEDLLSGWDSEKDEPLNVEYDTWEKADKKLAEAAKKAGHDGIVFHGHDDLNPVQYIAVDPKAITSPEKVGQYNWSSLKVEPEEAEPKAESAKEAAAETPAIRDLTEAKDAGKAEAMQKLVDKLNAKDWWHVVPEQGPSAYAHRGKFMSSQVSDFYGPQLREPQKVSIENPVVGTEKEIAEKIGLPPQWEDMGYEENKKLDRQWAMRARKLGYDAIVTMGRKQLDKFLSGGRLPRDMEIQDLTHVDESLPTPKAKTGPDPVGIHEDDLPRRAKYADVDFEKPDLQDTAKKVTAESIRKDYVREKDRNKVSVYKSYIPMEDLPTPKFVDKQEENFDREDYRPRVGSPIKVDIHPNGSVNILDGNHRVTVWNEQDQQYAPAWVVDHRGPNIEMLSEDEKAERDEED